MKEDSFLKKFKGRTEQIGRNGYADIMNNVHINIVDYIPKPKKVKKPKIKVDKYEHIRSSVIEEFNKNINFISQTKKISSPQKKNKKEEIEKINDNIGINNNKSNNIHKFNMKNNFENNKIKVKEKEKEKPIKLLKNIKYNIINNNDKNSPRVIQSSNIKNNKSTNINKKRINHTENNYTNDNNELKESKKSSNSIKLKLKLPKIPPQMFSSPKKNMNNLIIDESNIKKSKKSHERINTFTPMYNNKEKSDIKIFNDNIKTSKNKRINTETNNLKNYIINKDNKDYNFPKINNKSYQFTKSENDKNIKIFNKQKDLILNNIKNDFLMLDSIKNKGNNLAKSQIQEKKNNYQIDNNKLYNYINNKDNNNKQFFDYSNKKNDSKELNKINNLNMNLSRNYYQNLNKNKSFETNDDKMPHTSFDSPKNIPKLKNKLDIIHEENEDENKYITDVKFNNSFEDREKLNSLEILMKQRAHFQNKIPKDSRFKLK